MCVSFFSFLICLGFFFFFSKMQGDFLVPRWLRTSCRAVLSRLAPLSFLNFQMETASSVRKGINQGNSPWRQEDPPGAVSPGLPSRIPPLKSEMSPPHIALTAARRGAPQVRLMKYTWPAPPPAGGAGGCAPRPRRAARTPLAVGSAQT